MPAVESGIWMLSRCSWRGNSQAAPSCNRAEGMPDTLSPHTILIGAYLIGPRRSNHGSRITPTLQQFNFHLLLNVESPSNEETDQLRIVQNHGFIHCRLGRLDASSSQSHPTLPTWSYLWFTNGIISRRDGHEQRLISDYLDSIDMVHCLKAL